MPTTANYSWPTPADTDLVKNGADAMRDLGDAIDTTVKSVSDGRGLVHINKTTMSAVSAQSFDNVFSSTYRNYRIIIDATSTTAGNWTLRYRTSGSDNSTGNYTFSGIGAGVGADVPIYTPRGNAANTYTIFNSVSNIRLDLNIYTPFAAVNTGWGGFFGEYNSNNLATPVGRFTANTSFDGFSLLCTQPMTGTISVYGYKE